MREPTAHLSAQGTAGRLTRADRERITAVIDWLLVLLDADDADPDREPSLGWSKTGATTRYDGHARLVDLEGCE